MEKENSSYYNYDDGEQSFYDEDEDLDNFSTSYEDHFDFIVDSLLNFGSKHEITDIEDFLCDYGDLHSKIGQKILRIQVFLASHATTSNNCSTKNLQPLPLAKKRPEIQRPYIKMKNRKCQLMTNVP